MRYLVAVKPGSSQEKIVATVPTGGSGAVPAAPEPSPAALPQLTVFLHARAHDGEANAALIAALAKHFNVPKTAIHILRGAHSRTKLIEIPG